MKRFILVLFFFLSVAVYSQTFHSLVGIENQQDETLLLYRLGSDYFFYNSIYKFNTSTLSEIKIIDAFNNNFPGGQLAKSCRDFEFFPGDENNFMNVGGEINPDNHSYIARNDTAVFGGFGEFTCVDISKQNPMKVFAFGDGTRRSFDGGYTFPGDSVILIPGFIPLSVTDYDDNIFFGIDEDSRFAKNGAIVDTAKLFFDNYFKILYDINQQYIYLVSRSYNSYQFRASNNQGNAYTWLKTYESENPLLICSDPSQSGLLYLADGKKILRSTDHGITFTLFKNIERRITGIYKKPGAEVLYAATPYKIFKFTPDTSIVIKSLPIQTDIFNWFPLTVGNLWVYKNTFLSDWCLPWGSETEELIRINKDTVISGKTYFKFEPPLAYQYEYVRIDSAEGVLKWLSHDTTEINIYDFLMLAGDTVLFNPADPYSGFVLFNDEQRIIFNELRPVRDLMTLAFLPPSYSLVKGLGYHEDTFCEFGGWIRTLKGCVINGEVFGDTVFVNVNDNSNTLTEYSLYQNYPNPFNSRTIIKYSLSSRQFVTLDIFDPLGKKIATLVNEEKARGIHEIDWDAGNLSSGIFFYQIKAGNFTSTKKLVLLK